MKDFEPFDFFVLRTPLLPLDTVHAWAEGLRSPSCWQDGAAGLDAAVVADAALLAERLQAVYREPWVRDAFSLNSTQLTEGLDRWLAEPAELAARSTFLKVPVHYFMRMAARASPLGLMSGSTAGDIAPGPPGIDLEPRSAYVCAPYADRDWAHALIAGGPAIDRPVAPNSTCYRIGEGLRLVEVGQARNGRTFELVEFEASPALDAALAIATDGVTVAALREALVAADACPRDEVDAFVGALVQSQVLEPERLVGDGALDPLRSALAAEGSATHPRRAAWAAASAAVAALGDRDSPAAGEAFAATTALLRGIDSSAGDHSPLRVDLHKPATRCVLCGPVVAEVARGVDLFHRLNRRATHPRLDAFKARFFARYGDREVPLMEVLDAEHGIGYPLAPHDPGSEGDFAGLLPAGLGGVSAPAPLPSDDLRRRLYRRAMATQAYSVELDAADLQKLDYPAECVLDTFSVVVSVHADSQDALRRGEFRIAFSGGLIGPAGNYEARCSATNPDLVRRLEQICRADAALNDGALVAEVIHRPQGRAANISFRPALRDYEIVCLGEPNVDRAHQLPVNDLLLSLHRDRLVLRSRRLGKLVLPRITSTHDTFGLAPLYWFLGDFDQDYGEGFAGLWQWREYQHFAFLPRVTSGRIILAPASWTVEAADLPGGDPLTGAFFAAFQQWRQRMRVPRYVFAVEGDRRLLVDLDNVLAIRAITERCRARGTVRIEESLWERDPSVVRGPEGGFVHEIVVPFRRRTPRRLGAAMAHVAELARGSGTSARRTFPPGSDWFSTKVYGSADALDELLRQRLGPACEDLRQQGRIRSWFFVRHGEGGPHLRVRMRMDGDPTGVFERFAETVERGGIARWEIVTYERELERYGAGNIEAVEEFFGHDSAATLQALLLRSRLDDAPIWSVAAGGVDVLLRDLGYADPRARLEFVTSVRDARAAELGVGSAWWRRAHDRGKRDRELAWRILEGAPGAGAELRSIWQQRSTASAAAVGRLRGDLPIEDPVAADRAASLVHMFCNRVYPAGLRFQELVLHTLLARFYREAIGRGRAPP